MTMKKKGIFSILILAGAALTASVPAANAQTKAEAEKNPTLPAGLDKQFMDSSADPCVNFAQYACGNFTKIYPIPADMAGYGSGSIVFEHTEYALHSLLEKVAANDPSRTPDEQKTGDFYATCMDTDAIQAAGMKPLRPELDRIADLKSKSELTALLAHFQLINVNAFFSYGEQQDFKDARKQIPVVDQGGLGLPERDYYLRTGEAADKTRQQYVQHITNVLKLMGEPEEKAASDAQKIMQLETALAKVSMDITSQRDPKNVYHPMPVSQLAGLAPEIAWTNFFEHTGVSDVTDLNVANPDFFKGLNSLLQSTDLDTIKTYLRWQLINGTPSYALPTAFDDEDFNFFGRDLRGQPQQRARWKRCVQATDGALGEAVGQVYVKAYFPAESKAKTVQMVHDIEAAMDARIDTLTWMSPETKVKAKQKLHMVADKIGYPDHSRDYSSLTIVRGDAVGNATRAVEFENHRELAKIGKPVDRGEWGMSAPTVNAYYNPSMNDINFPAGILQAPFFDPAATDAENYGHVGAIVGHELTHGFDDQGRQFDGNGNLADWWTPDDGKKFETMTDCEVKEYGNFTAVDDVKVNGKLTLGENTADNGGLRLAYMAFLADAKRKGIDLTAKDANGFTPTQEFFLAYGQNWCGSIRPQQVRLQVQTDPHSPRQFRIIGVVQNMPEFGNAFGCKPGQPMMPENACHVW
ncbi:MAG TPA: M13 family metallopeptidase [Terriglobales bacterium]|jgi:endothelin-converting enzyme/putative endopeptidase